MPGFCGQCPCADESFCKALTEPSAECVPPPADIDALLPSAECELPTRFTSDWVSWWDTWDDDVIAQRVCQVPAELRGCGVFIHWAYEEYAGRTDSFLCSDDQRLRARVIEKRQIPSPWRKNELQTFHHYDACGTARLSVSTAQSHSDLPETTSYQVTLRRSAAAGTPSICEATWRNGGWSTVRVAEEDAVYDAEGRLVMQNDYTITYDEQGRRASLSKGDKQYLFAYDSVGRFESMTYFSKGQARARVFDVRDENGSLSRRTYQGADDDWWLPTRYDAQGRPSEIAGSTIKRDDAGRITRCESLQPLWQLPYDRGEFVTNTFFYPDPEICTEKRVEKFGGL